MKFTVLETRFEYNLEQGTTTCTMAIVVKSGIINISDPYSQHIFKKLGFSQLGFLEVTKVAHLKPSDTWNPVVGKRVAEAKCCREIFTKMSKLNIALRAYAYTTLGIEAKKYITALVQEVDHFKDLSDGQDHSN